MVNNGLVHIIAAMWLIIVISTNSLNFSRSTGNTSKVEPNIL